MSKCEGTRLRHLQLLNHHSRESSSSCCPGKLSSPQKTLYKQELNIYYVKPFDLLVIISIHSLS